MPDARDELNRSVREGTIESRHYIKSLEWMGSSPLDLGAELKCILSLLIVTLFQMKKKLQ